MGERIFPILTAWLIGCIIAALAGSFNNRRISRGLNRLSNIPPALALPAATLLGAVSPITLFGVIPLFALLPEKRSAVISGMLLSFVTTSLLMNPSLFVFTTALGTGFALMRLFYSIAAGVLLGLLTLLFTSDGKDIFKPFETTGSDAPESIISPGRRQRFWTELFRIVRKTGLNMAIGFGISIILTLTVPGEVYRMVFGNSLTGVFASAALSVPLYYCGGGTIPILQGWMREGMSQGAAMVFVLAGPVTKLTNLSALKVILKWRMLLCYVAVFLIYCLAIGLIMEVV